MKLEGKKALVTGSSKGIGREIAIRLAREGAHVAINYNSDPKGADEALAEVTALGRKGAVLRANLGVISEVRDLVAKSADLLGGLDILVNAIAPGPIVPPPDLAQAEIDEVAAATPLGRWGGEIEIAKAVLALCETNFITGETIRVDGGRHLE